MPKRRLHISVVFTAVFLMLLGSSQPCRGQSNFWDKLFQIFQKEEPETKVWGEDRIEKGDTATLHWNIEEADSIHLKEVKKNLMAQGSIRVKPKKSRFYKFLVYRDDEPDTKYFKVDVFQPEIKYFKAPQQATDEEPVTLRWRVKNAKEIMLPGIAGNLEDRGRLSTLIKDTVVTLVAKGKFNTVRKKAKINLQYIENFQAPKKIYEEEKATLQWKYKNTKHIEIKGFKRKFPPIDTLTLQPEKTKKWELYVYRTSGTVDTISHKIRVSPPEITDFGGPKSIAIGQKVPVFWEVNGVDKAWLGDKEVPLKGNKAFKITQDTTFILKIYDKKGNKIQKKHRVIVLPPRKYVTSIDTTDFNFIGGLDCDIISVDQSNFPRQIKMRVLVVDTVGNYVHSLAPPYRSKEQAKRYFQSLTEKVGKKFYSHNFRIREIRREVSKMYNIAMSLDHSGSMVNIVDSMHRAVKSFVNYKYRKDQISIVKFDHFIKKMNSFETNKKAILNSANLDSLKNFGGATALYAGLDESIINLGKKDKNKVAILFTDGFENSSFNYLGKRAFTARHLAEKIYHEDIKLFIISFGDYVNKQVLNQLASLSGGKHYNIQRESNISQVFKELPRVFRYYYEITINPLDDDGKHTYTLTFSDQKGSMIKRDISIYTGDFDNDFKFRDYFRVPIYLLGEIPVRTHIITNPQVIARFDFDKHKVKMKYFPVIDRYTEFLKKNPDARIILAGHTDTKGSASYCQNLSEQRAKAVKGYFVSKGIDPYRIKWVGCGKEQLIWEPDETDWKAAENRRVEAVLYTE
jgi:flagellar motor protein MotB